MNALNVIVVEIKLIIEVLNRLGGRGTPLNLSNFNPTLKSPADLATQIFIFK